MTAQKVNLDTYSLSLLTAKEDILNPRSSANWALFAYDGVTNKLKLADSGAGGVAELMGKFHAAKPQYGLCKVGSGETGGLRIAMIIWVGENVDDFRRTECAGHVPAIRSFFKEAHVFLQAQRADEVTEEKIEAEINKTLNQAPSQWARRSSRSSDKEEIVGTNYRKTNAAMEMRRINRDSFWARAEREEEERKEEEKRRAADERKRLEKERVMRERKDAEERDRKMEEKLQMIEEQRKKQAEQEEEQHKKEKFKWEKQQKEHEDDMRAYLRRSESIEKAAEAAALVSQRTMNPREFFRQLSSSSQSPTSPGSSRAGRPFRRYQRSLTDTAFIFSKAEDSTSSSPRSPPLVSPFSRLPTSPIFRTTSPPRSPDFRPSPASPPASPLCPVVSPFSPQLSSDPQPNVQERRAPSPAEPSAPPASPTLLASLSSSPVKDISKNLPASPPNTPEPPENSTFNFELCSVPVAPSGPLPDRPQPNTDLSTAKVSGYKVPAVLVEEDEEEEQEEGEEEETQTEPGPRATEQVQVEEEEREEVEEKREEVNGEERKDIEEEKDEKEEVRVEAEAASQEETVEVKDEDEEDVQGITEAEDTKEKEVVTVPRAETAFPEVPDVSVHPSTNGIVNGEDTQEQNGIERSVSPSDTESSSPEVAVCYDLHGTAEAEEEEEDVTEIKEVELSENGQEVLTEQQMCVRALYDYQAEDESEISFQPGDIIRDVEAVDKAWWRGWSKDGRQGLFPANYVETI